MIIENLVVGSFETNCYIVGSESNKEGIIIDPGDEAKRILKKTKDLGLNIKTIVLTHAHRDHIGALMDVKKATGAALAIHTDEIEMLKLKFPQSLAASPTSQTPPTPERLLKGGDYIEVGDLRFLVLHTPGHTPGGICLLGDGVLFSGDTLFNAGIGRTDMPGGSETQLMNAILTKLMVLPNNTTVYPGHGPATTVGNERRWNPFFGA